MLDLNVCLLQQIHGELFFKLRLEVLKKNLILAGIAAIILPGGKINRSRLALQRVHLFGVQALTREIRNS